VYRYNYISDFLSRSIIFTLSWNSWLDLFCTWYRGLEISKTKNKKQKKNGWSQISIQPHQSVKKIQTDPYWEKYVWIRFFFKIWTLKKPNLDRPKICQCTPISRNPCVFEPWVLQQIYPMNLPNLDWIDPELTHFQFTIVVWTVVIACLYYACLS
jgi:hypothetical protein